MPQIVDKPSVCQRICPTACLRTAHALRRRGVPWLRTALRSVCSPLQPFGSQTLASSLAALVAHWAHFGLFRSSIRNSRLATLPLASLLCSLDFRFACFAHCARRSSVPVGLTTACFRHWRRPSFASSIRNGRPAAPDGLQFSFAHWAYFGLFRALRAAFVRFLNSAWSSRIFAPPCADACAVFRGCALRFAPCARHSSPSGLRCSQSSLATLPCLLGLLRPASATGGGLRAPLFAKREAIDGAIPEDGVRPLAEESPRPASALPSEGAQEAPREEGQSLHRGCAAPKGSPWHQGELSAKLTEGFFDPSVTACAVPPSLQGANP